MFRESADRLRAWLTEAGDLLLGEPERSDLDYHADHPHRRELRWERSRRPGSVPARPAHCISPIRREPTTRAIHYR